MIKVISIEIDKSTKRSDRQRRILGCIRWAIFLSLASSGLLILFTYVFEKSRSSYFSWNMDLLIWFGQWFLIYLVPITIIAIIVGGLIKLPHHLRNTFIVVTPLVTIIYSLWIHFLYSSPLNEDPPKPIGETFWNPPIIGLTALISGIFLGLVASYGYWHAGRQKSKKGITAIMQDGFLKKRASSSLKRNMRTEVDPIAGTTSIYTMSWNMGNVRPGCLSRLPISSVDGLPGICQALLWTTASRGRP